MRTVIIGFGLLILSLLILFKISEVNFVQGNVRLEVIVAIAAIIFFFIGVYFNRPLKEKITASQQPVTPETISASAVTQTSTSITPVAMQEALSPSIDYTQIKRLGLTQREHDVLVKMAEGLSNQEIAAALFLSESTIKTHVSNILFKMDVKRRTAAVQAAKQLRIIQ